jgi:hypothetical protein
LIVLGAAAVVACVLRPAWLLFAGLFALLGADGHDAFMWSGTLVGAAGVLAGK